MSKVITRSQLIKAIELLGLDPNTILELHIFPTHMTGTEFVKTLDGTETKSCKVTMQAGEIPKRDFRMQVKGEGK